MLTYIGALEAFVREQDAVIRNLNAQVASLKQQVSFWRGQAYFWRGEALKWQGIANFWKGEAGRYKRLLGVSFMLGMFTGMRMSGVRTRTEIRMVGPFTNTYHAREHLRTWRDTANEVGGGKPTIDQYKEIWAGYRSGVDRIVEEAGGCPAGGYAGGSCINMAKQEAGLEMPEALSNYNLGHGRACGGEECLLSTGYGPVKRPMCGIMTVAGGVLAFVEGPGAIGKGMAVAGLACI